VSKPSRDTAVIVLAAGAGVRLGGDKAQRTLGGRSLLDHVLGRLASHGFGEAVVVSGAYQPTPESIAGRARVVVNQRWAEGRTGSIQAGLRATPEGSGWLLWPVDVPLIKPSTLGALRAAIDADPGAQLFIPSYKQRRGHPVFLRPRFAERLAGLDPRASPRSLFAALDERELRHVEVDDPGVLLDLNTHEQLRAAERWLRSQ
jgi:molybdenum cofactor cytidylyltransferase